VKGAYTLWQMDAYKYKYHSGLTMEVLEVVQAYIQFVADLTGDMRLAYDLLIDQDYFESQYEAINQGKIRRWNGSAWAFATEIAQTTAAVMAANAPKHVLWYSTVDKLFYTPSVTPGDENKFQASTVHADAPTNALLLDLPLWAAGLMKKKGARAEYYNFHPDLIPIMASDPRWNNLQVRSGNIVFASEQGYLGKFFLGGTQSQSDVWELPQGVLDAKVTADVGAYKIYPVLVGEYGRSGVIAPWIPVNMTMDKGFEVKTIDAVSVLRPNDTEVFTLTGHQAVMPWDINGLSIVKVVKVAHT